ncbi:hypothetical protein BG004_006968 [Podila humilis]|nr:hypothetical protein BG004_006968 [Podila humilis]
MACIMDHTVFALLCLFVASGAISLIYYRLKEDQVTADTLWDVLFLLLPFSLYHAWVFVLMVINVFAVFSPAAAAAGDPPSMIQAVLAVVGLSFVASAAIGYIEFKQGDVAGAQVLAWYLFGVYNQQHKSSETSPPPSSSSSLAAIYWTALGLGIAVAAYTLKPLVFRIIGRPSSGETAPLLGLWSLLLPLLVFAISFAEACERQCQVNVSHAFAEKYQFLSTQYFTLLDTRLQQSLFYGLPAVESLMTAEETTLTFDRLSQAVNRAQHSWDLTLFLAIFDSIFLDEPKFKGDCSDPFRVVQPILGVNWTMEDCHSMNYICGNPPSICHFLPMIKTRILAKLKKQLALKMGGSGSDSNNKDSDVFVNFLEPTLQSILMDQPSLMPYKAHMHGNVNQILEIVRVEILNGFATVAEDGSGGGGGGSSDDDDGDGHGKGKVRGVWEHGWDLEIKNLLLTFP